MWIVPSRNRPHLVQHMFDTAPPATPGIIAIDDDQVDMYEKVKLPPHWKLDVSPRARFVIKNNEILSRYPNELWYGTLNDDMYPITKRWDLQLVQAAGDWGIAWCEDTLWHKASTVVQGGKFVRECGFLFIPAVEHFYCDDAQEMMGKELGNGVFLASVIVEHRHYTHSKESRKKRAPARMDATYLSRPEMADDEVKYRKWLATEWPALKEKLAVALSK